MTKLFGLFLIVRYTYFKHITSVNIFIYNFDFKDQKYFCHLRVQFVQCDH